MIPPLLHRHPGAGRTRIWLACGATDMRKGFDGLAVLVQQVLEQSPHSGALFAFRGKRGHLVKLLWYDGQGLCLFSKRMDRGRFIWPMTKVGSVASPRPSFRCCSKGSTGGGPNGPGGRRWRDKQSRICAVFLA